MTTAALLGAALALALAPEAKAAPDAVGDFDGDGRSDLAIGAPRDSVSGHDLAGAVNVIYGSRGRGLREDPDQEFTQDTPGIIATAEAGDRFGAALAAGDFDCDGHADLAIGAPGEQLGSARASGAVTVLYGSSRGLTTRDTFFDQGYAGVPGTRERGQSFGAALAVGDFDDNRCDDLAVGVPGDSVHGAPGAGVVDVLYSTRAGVRGGPAQLWTQDTSGVKGLAGSFHRFGRSLAAADFDDDGDDDLAIGLPGGRIAGVRAGAVSVLYSSGGRLRQAGDQLWSQGARGIKGAPEASDGFGWALAAGDLDQDGDVELAIGVPFEDLGGTRDAGAVNLLYSGDRGLKSADAFITQASPGIKGAPETGDRFGLALASGDFDRDYEDDLAIGTPLEDLAGISDAGAVNIIYGSERTGVSRRDDFWSQGSRGITGHPEAFDDFGSALAVGDFDGEGHDDLAIGAPLDSVQGAADAGAVNVIDGSHRALTAAGDQLWTQGTRGINGAVGNDGFGSAFGTGHAGR
jgi:hypothetical protein